MQSYEYRGCEPLSPHSVHRHLVLLHHPGIPAMGSLDIGHVTTETKMHGRKQWLFESVSLSQ